MRKRHTDSWQTVPQTTQELRYSCELNRENEDSDHSKYTRGKRRKKTLPNSWDDKRCGSWDLRKSWKEKRGKQYYGRKQLQEFKIESTNKSSVPAWMSRHYCWFLSKEQKYLEEMKIPHKISREYKIEVEVRTTRWTFVKDGKTKPVYHWKAKPDGTYPVYYWVETGEWGYIPCKPYEVHHKTLTKETITYWNNKELIFNY